MDMEDDGCQALSTPEATAAPAVDLPSPKPPHHPSGGPTGAAQPAPTGQAAPPVTPADTHVRLRNE